MNFGRQNEAKIDAKTCSKMGWIFHRFLKVFGVPKWSPNGYEKGARSDHFLEYFRVRFRHAFWSTLWVAKTTILVLSLRRRAFFHIFTMSKKVPKLMPNAFQNWCLWVAKMSLKINQKIIKKNIDFWMDFGFWAAFLSIFW